MKRTTLPPPKKIGKAKMNYKHNVLFRKRIPTTSRNSYKPDLV